jgi:hypothetical protein
MFINLGRSYRCINNLLEYREIKTAIKTGPAVQDKSYEPTVFMYSDDDDAEMVCFVRPNNEQN